MRIPEVDPACSKSVLVTGASSGLGQVTARHLASLGYRVFAGSRTEVLVAESASAERGELIPVRLDVTDRASIADAVALVDERCRRTGLWAIVNNAGIGCCSPVEATTPQVARSMVDTNILGVLAVTQGFLPALRDSGGRIVNVGSGLGNIGLPFFALYVATQFAKEGLTDALRRELRPVGVAVSLVEAGAIRTPLWDKMRESTSDVLAATPLEMMEPYHDRYRALADLNQARATKSPTTPEAFARTVARALAARRPKARYRVGIDSWGSVAARRFGPDRFLDAVLALDENRAVLRMGPAR